MKFRFPKLKFNFRREQKRPSVVQQKGETFRQQRVQQRRQEQLRRMGQILNRYKLIIIGVVVLVVLAGVVTAVAVVLRNNNVLVVKSVVVRGNQALTSEEIIAAIPEVQGQTMIAISARGIEQKLLVQFPYLKEVYVRKFIPDRLEIEVKERFPVLIYVNMSTSASIDDEGVVLNVFSNEAVTELSSDELEIIVGYGDPNANRVKEKYLASLQTEEERQKTKWEEVKPEDKQKALNELRADYVARYESQLRKHSNAVQEELRASLPVLQDLSSKTYNIGDRFPGYKFNATRNVLSYLQLRAISPTRFLWNTDFNISVILPSNTQIIFTTSRSIDDQIAALETLRKVEDITRARVVDVRATVVSVK